MEDFEDGLNSVPLNSVITLELDASLEEADVLPSLVSSGFLHIVSTVSDTSRLQLGPIIKASKLWYQARALLLPVTQAGKMSASKLMYHFSGIPAAIGFLASLLSENITLNPANIRTDQTLTFILAAYFSYQDCCV